MVGGGPLETFEAVICKRENTMDMQEEYGSTRPVCLAGSLNGAGVFLTVLQLQPRLGPVLLEED